MTTNDHLNAAKSDETRLNSGAGSATIGKLLAKITAQISVIVRNELILAKLEAQAKVQKLGVGGFLLALAALLSLYFLGLLLFAAVQAFALLLPLWAAYLVVAGIVLLIILILLLSAAKMFKSSAQHQPNPKLGLQKDLDAVKKGIGK